MTIRKQTLYAWQEQCLQQWFSHHGRGIVQAVTGSGKTRLALEALCRLEDLFGEKLRIKIVVPTEALMLQWRTALLEAADDPDAMRRSTVLYGAGYHPDSELPFAIYIVNSARYSLARQILQEISGGYSVFLIADECHHYASGQNRLIFEFLPLITEKKSCFFSLGLTATLPGSDNGRYLQQVLGPRIYHYGMQQALQAGTLCRYDVFHIELSLLTEEAADYLDYTERMQHIFRTLAGKGLLSSQQTKAELFDQLKGLTHHKDPKLSRMASGYLQLSYLRKKLVCLAEARIPCAVRLVELLAETGRKTVIFGERISQADQLYRELSLHFPGKIGRCHSQMGTQANRNALNRFRDGEYQILITCKALDEGINIPDISVGIILSGTSMERQRIQRLGRIVRNAPGKESASLYYLHVSETTEDRVFLPDIADTKLAELSYQPDTDSFARDTYDALAEQLLREFSDKGAALNQLEEAAAVLDQGRIQNDWMHPEADFKAKISDARTMREKNYWRCMEKIAGMFS